MARAVTRDKMNDMVKEIIGFLCRWVLLCITAAGGVGIGWAFLRGGTVVAAGSPTLQQSDAIGSGWQRNVALGYLIPPNRRVGRALFTTSGSDGSFQLVSGGPKYAYVGVPDTQPGLKKIQVRGIIYSATAFEHVEAFSEIVPPSARVICIDARLMSGVGSGRLLVAVRRLEQFAHVVLLHLGTHEEFPEVRQIARRKFPNTPLVFAIPRRSDVTYPLRRITYMLKHSGRNSAAPELLTADETLARRAAAKGFSVHWISPDQKKRYLSGNLATYNTLPEFTRRITLTAEIRSGR